MTRTGPVPPQMDLPIRPCRDADCKQSQAVLSRSFHAWSAVCALDGAEVDLVAVQVEHQNRGLAWAMVSLLKGVLMRRGHPTLWCVVGNPARRVYDALGVCGTIRGGISKKEPLKETARGN